METENLVFEDEFEEAFLSSESPDQVKARGMEAKGSQRRRARKDC